MTPEELRAEIPATDDVAYFNTGASGPSPRRVVEAVCDFQSYHEYTAPGREGMYEAGWGTMDEIRESVAAFLGAGTSEIGFTRSTADSINLVAGAIDWEAGDTVVRTDLEHPAGILPWRRLQDTHGISVEVVASEAGRFDLDAWVSATEDARLVVTSSLAWNYGTTIPVREIVDIAHENGAMVLVDSVQSVGHEPIDVSEWGADFVAGSAHKWPLGPWGSGFLYIDSAAQAQLRPTRIGGRSVEDAYSDEYAYREGAAMVEVSTGPTAIYAGMETALDTIAAVGFDTIQSHMEQLTDRLKAGIPDARLRSPSGFESGLVTFEVPDPDGSVERCKQEGIILRTVPPLESVRASIHVFNTAEEVDALIEAIP